MQDEQSESSQCRATEEFPVRWTRAETAQRPAGRYETNDVLTPRAHRVQGTESRPFAVIDSSQANQTEDRAGKGARIEENDAGLLYTFCLARTGWSQQSDGPSVLENSRIRTSSIRLKFLSMVRPVIERDGDTACRGSHRLTPGPLRMPRRVLTPHSVVIEHPPRGDWIDQTSLVSGRACRRHPDRLEDVSGIARGAPSRRHSKRSLDPLLSVPG